MEDEAGHIVHEEDQIAKTISEYYQNLFTADPLVDLSALEDIQLPLVSQSINDALIKLPDKEEIRKAGLVFTRTKLPVRMASPLVLSLLLGRYRRRHL